jgi:hypothetical protein
VFETLTWETLKIRRDYLKTIFIYKILNLAASNLNNLFSKISNCPISYIIYEIATQTTTITILHGQQSPLHYIYIMKIYTVITYMSNSIKDRKEQRSIIYILFISYILLVHKYFS